MEEVELMNKLEELALKRDCLATKQAQFDLDNAETIRLIANLEAEIKQEVLNRGETVKSKHMVVTWNKGRVSWNSRLLDGYAVAHPEILEMRKEGSPTVSFRIVADEKKS